MSVSVVIVSADWKDGERARDWDNMCHVQSPCAW